MQRIEILDYGRFIAALAVLCFHWFFINIFYGNLPGIQYEPALVDVVKYGYLGVEFFFMISGYVIFFSATNRTATQFACLRATRLYPAFWVCLLLTSLALWIGTRHGPGPLRILANATMDAERLGYEFVDGVYWTLIYELRFYLLIYVLLLLGLGKWLHHVALIWPIAIAVLWLSEIRIHYFGGFYVYFAGGMLLASLRERFTMASLAGLPLVLLMCLIHTVQRVAWQSEHKNIDYSIAVAAALVVGFYLLFLLAGTRRGGDLRLPAAALLAGLTYPLYLLHNQIGVVLLAYGASENTKWIAYATVFMIVLGLSAAVHLGIEKQLRKIWRRLFEILVGYPSLILEKRLNQCRLGFRRFILTCRGHRPAD